MKIKIIYNFTEEPTGGGNQFLKALKNDLFGFYTENNEEADVFLFNSYHDLKEVVSLKRKFPQKVFVHRLGPLFYLHRGKRWKMVDKALLDFSQKIADGFVFQSAWSYEKAKELGFKAGNAKVILNWPDQSIFFPLKEKILIQSPHEKTKLIALSWSANLNKGFSFYNFLDENLDFARYEMKFLGNLPQGFQFKNIKHIEALPSGEVAQHLRESDIFVFAGKDEACSNALIEAVASGLRVVALDSGSNKEIVKTAGELFLNEKELLEKIEKVKKDYFSYKTEIKNGKNDYLSFFQVLKKQKNKGFFFSFLKLKLSLLICRIL